jgi:RHS repeat-associated protein
VLLARDGNVNDSEHYQYDGKGQRQQKLRTWQAAQQCHKERVRYLPELELREKWQENLDSSNKKTKERLQLLHLNAGSTSMRLLHWETGKPDSLENDQQRYSIDNHLGSCQLELDKNAQLISYEEYYPYGGTAIWSCRNRSEATYKYVRYSGKERDSSGLYYYGARYYIPWLGRWLNPDPAGTMDGLNLFRMVQNNPINLLDKKGTKSKHFSQLSKPFKRLYNFLTRTKSPHTANTSETRQITKKTPEEPMNAVYNKRTDSYIDFSKDNLSNALDLISKGGVDAYSRKNTALENSFFNSLSPSEEIAVQKYTEGSAIFNSQCNQEKPIVQNLRTGLAKIKPLEHIVTFRGSGTEAGVWGNKIQVGDTVTSGSRFTSTSMDFGISKNFAQQIKDSSQDKILFLINSTAGRDVTATSFYQHEKEILLLPNSNFIVDAIETKGNLKYVMLSQTEGPSFLPIQNASGNTVLQSLGKNIFNGNYDQIE